MFCRRCGKEIVEAAKFCPKCGTQTPVHQTKTAEKFIPPGERQPQPYIQDSSQTKWSVSETDYLPPPYYSSYEPQSSSGGKAVGSIIAVVAIIIIIAIAAGNSGGLKGTYKASDGGVGFNSEVINIIEFKSFGKAEIHTYMFLMSTHYVDCKYRINRSNSTITLKAEWNYFDEWEETYHYEEYGNTIYLNGAKFVKTG